MDPSPPLPEHAASDVHGIAAELRGLSPDYAPTPLLDVPRLASRLGVAQVLIKNEGRRALGSFKSLGGTYAGLRALARGAGRDIAALLAKPKADLPTLLCASDGNHGLAVAAAARFAGAPARIFLHSGVPAARARRIEAQGAAIAWVDGTYDDAVDAAAAAAGAGAGILIPDTTYHDADPVVADVMAGYGIVAAEIRMQVEEKGCPRPSHLLVQAGVGGLAAAMATGLKAWMAPPAAIVAVEPERAACLSAAMKAGRVVRIPGNLHTAAEMLSCGEASAPALEVLRRHGAQVVTVSESALDDAPRVLLQDGGPATTPSGAAGLAGAVAFAAGELSVPGLRLGPEARLLLIVTEGEVPET